MSAAEPTQISPNTAVSQSEQSMQTVLDKQRTAHLKDGPPSAERRIEWLDRCIGLLVDHDEEIKEAISADFGHRSHEQTGLTDVMGSIGPLKFAKSNLRKWMKPERRRAEFPLGLLGAKAELQYQPLGVVGVISPWNFPVNLTFSPLAGILAAGNRCMIKPSEYTPVTSELMTRMFRTAFDETEIAVVTGGADVGAEFSKLAFDHLLFTGATSVAHHIMRAAADNLVPVTLELGGKSPVVVSKSADMDDVAKKVMTGKMMNAGQICLAPDYVCVPNGRVDEFVGATEKAVRSIYPTLKDNPDYTSVVNQRHYERLQSYITDAKEKGATVKEINPANEDFTQQEHRKIPPTLVLNPTDNMKIMQDEIFGPLLPVKTYDGGIDEPVNYINSRPRPLAVYYFGNDTAEKESVLTRTTSGGATVNDVIMHVAQEDLPFGGVGPSGMGAYHGREGFKNFSHAKAVYSQAKMDIGAMLRPPYTEKTRKFLSGRTKR